MSSLVLLLSDDDDPLPPPPIEIVLQTEDGLFDIITEDGLLIITE